MAEEKNIQPEAKAEKKSAAAKPVKEKISFGEKVKRFFRNYKSEFKKIVWSSKDQVIKNTSVVVALVIISGIILVALDLAFNMSITALGRLI